MKPETADSRRRVTAGWWRRMSWWCATTGATAVGTPAPGLVRIEDEKNVDKVRRLGVDQVISPSTLGGRLLAEQAVELGGRTAARTTGDER